MADDRSPYLVQALQSMQQGAPQAQAPQGPSLQQMQDIAQKRQAWEAANPGQSYMAHGFKQMGQNIMGAPGAMMQGAQNIAGIPGQAASGFQNLIKGLPGFSQAPTQYGGVPTGAGLA